MDKITYPKISIITPSFNQGEYLEQTILSVLDQNYPNLEYIIIDGGSTDNSVEIIKKYEKQLAYWVSEKDRGQSDAINKGINKATGEIFNWLNSDDFYSPGVLQGVANLFLNGAEVACGKVRFLYADGTTGMTSKFPHSEDVVEVISSTKYVQQSTFYKMDFIKSVGGVNQALHYGMDFELWLKYVLMHGLKGIKNDDSLIANFRIHGASKTFLSNNDFFKDWMKIFDSIKSLVYGGNVKRINAELGNYKFEVPRVGMELRTVKEAVARFFYDSLVFAYGKRDFLLFKKVLGLLDLELLDSKRISEVNKMNFRKKILPHWLLKLSK